MLGVYIIYIFFFIYVSAYIIGQFIMLIRLVLLADFFPFVFAKIAAAALALFVENLRRRAV